MAKKEKQAIALTVEQTERANKMGTGIYGLSYLGFVFLMLITGEMSFIGLGVMVAMFVACAVLAMTKGKEENTHIMMSVTFLLMRFVPTRNTTLMIELNRPTAVE